MGLLGRNFQGTTVLCWSFDSIQSPPFRISLPQFDSESGGRKSDRRTFWATAMGVTKEQILARLQELEIGFQQCEHPVVLTVEAQAQHVGHLRGALSKNLFLKDKKQRYYIVSALAETKVDLKVLSQRLGLGKGGLRMAPEDALAEILQVPLGCVTPFAIVNESARHVSLLLDQGFKSKESCFFHPLSNDMTIALNAQGLNKFLNSIGKTPSYVDLEANPPVGKDHPPDLAALVPSDALGATDPPEKQGSSQAPEKNNIPSNNQPKVVPAKPVKSPIPPPKGKLPGAVNSSVCFADPDKFVEEILEKMASIILSDIKEENGEKHREQLTTTVSNSISKQLGLELKNIATIFKNTAYTEGFSAGIQHQPRRM